MPRVLVIIVRLTKLVKWTIVKQVELGTLRIAVYMGEVKT